MFRLQLGGREVGPVLFVRHVSPGARGDDDGDCWCPGPGARQSWVLGWRRAAAEEFGLRNASIE